MEWIFNFRNGVLPSIYIHLIPYILRKNSINDPFLGVPGDLTDGEINSK